jgi:NTP pyrophosphatase (non-canonical NTP hydrolase)
MDKISDEKLENEIADVILSTIRLARMMDLDVNEILKNKMEILKERFEKN